MEAIKTYLKEIRDIPLLSLHEEVELTKKVKKGDEKARKKMIRANLRLVINISKRYVHLGIPLMDLIEEGNMGLIKAVEKFDPKKGYRFSTYAAWWIKQSITRSISDQGRFIRVPVYVNELIAKMKKANEQLSQKLNRPPTAQELAKKLKIPLDKINQINRWISAKPMSLETPIGQEGDDVVKDLIEDERVISPDKQARQFLDKERLSNLLEMMDKREREILDLRFGLADGATHTLAAIARKLKLSRERIRQIEHSALRKLRRFVHQQEKEKVW